MCARASAGLLLEHLDRQVTSLAALARRHRDDLMAGRTLTQHAVPITFGLKAAQWLQGVLDARDDLRALRFPIQVGGAAGTLAAVAELAGDADAARFVVAEAARTLDLDHVPPWHTSRAPFTRYADALVRATDAMGHIANDVLLLGRPEIGELAEPAVEGRGGSSTMPQKANPVLSVLIRRAALAAPGLAAQLHLAAAATVDERPDGSWHVEWSALADLSRHTLTAASQTAELLDGLHVDTARMAAVVKQQSSALTAEQRSIAALLDREPGTDPRHYLGAAGEIIDEVLARADDEAGRTVSVPSITAVRLTGAAHRAELPLLVLGPSLGTSATTLWEPLRRRAHRRLRRRCVGPPRARPQPRRARRATSRWPSWRRACSAWSTRSSSSATSSAAPSRTPATRSAAASVSSSSSTSPTGSPRPCCCAPARGSATPAMWAGRIGQVSVSGTSVMVSGSAERWFGPGFLEREQGTASALLHALQDADDQGYIQVCQALADFDVRERLGEIATPVLAVVGQRRRHHDTGDAARDRRTGEGRSLRRARRRLPPRPGRGTRRAWPG